MIFGSGASSGVLGLGVVFTLKDQFSRTADQINRKFKDLDQTTDRLMNKMQHGMKVAKVGLGMMAAGGLIVGALAPAVMKTAELSDKMADVRKTTGMAAMEAENLKKSLYALDTRTSIGELLDISTISGQMGVASDQILGFTSAMDKAVVALGDEFGGGADQVASTLGGVRNVLSDIKSANIGDDLLHIANALNELGASGIATSPVLSDFATRMGGMGISLGMTSGEVLGLSAVMQESAISSERGSSAVIQSMLKMTTHIDDFAKIAGVSGANFKQMVNNDILGAFKAVVKGATSGGVSATDFAATLDALGLDGVRTSETFALLSKNLDMVDDKVRMATNALGGMDSVMNEFNIKNNTLQATLDKAANRWERLLDIVGGAAATVFGPIVQALTKMIDLFADFAATGFGQWLIGTIAAIGSALVVVGGIVAAIGAFKMALAGAQLAMTAFGLTASAVFPPLLIAVAVIGAVVGAVQLGKKSLDEFGKAMEDNKQITGGWTGFLQKTGGLLAGIGAIWSSATSEGFSMSEQMASTLENMGILDHVLALGTWIVRIKEMFRGIGDSFKMTWSVIKPIVGMLKNAIYNAMDAVGMSVDKASGSMEIWRKIGKGIGFLLQVTLVPAVWALSGIIGGMVWGFTQLVLVGKIVWNVLQSIGSAITSVITSFLEMIDGVVNGMMNMYEGIKDIPIVGSIVDMVSGSVDGAATGGPEATTTTIQNQMAENRAAEKAASGSTIIDKSQTTEKMVQPVFVIDGQEFAGMMRRQDELDESRQ